MLLLGTLAAGLAACGGATFAIATGGDAGGVDGGSIDAAPDAGDFCASHAGQFDFCSDFDQAALPENWDLITKTGSSQVSEDGADSTSAPNSLLVTTPQLGAGQGDAGAPTQSAVLVKKQLPHGTAHVAFDLQLDDVTFPNPTDPNAGVALLALTFGKEYALLLSLRPPVANGGSTPFTLWMIEAASPAFGPRVLTPTPIATLPQTAPRWSHVKVDVTLASSGSQATVTIDSGTPTTIGLTPPSSAIPGDRTMTIGSAATGPCGEAKLRFDDVTWSH